MYSRNFKAQTLKWKKKVRRHNKTIYLISQNRRMIPTNKHNEIPIHEPTLPAIFSVRICVNQ